MKPYMQSITRETTKCKGYHVLELDSNHATNRRACIFFWRGPTLCWGTATRSPSQYQGSGHGGWDAALSSSSDGGIENSLDAQAFLQLLVTFGTSLFMLSAAAALCQALGLKHRMSDFMETLNKDGKQIEALCFAHHFGLMDKIQPAAMVKAYLKEVHKAAQEMPKNGANPKHELMMELSAVKALLRAVEEYNLGEQFATDGLQKWLVQLEKSKADRRMGKSQMQYKKPHLSSGGQGSHSGPADREQYGGANAVPYGISGQAAYDRCPQAAYGSVYGTDSRSLGSLSQTPTFALLMY